MTPQCALQNVEQTAFGAEGMFRRGLWKIHNYERSRLIGDSNSNTQSYSHIMTIRTHRGEAVTGLKDHICDVVMSFKYTV